MNSDRSIDRARCPLCGAPGKPPPTPFGTRWGGRKFEYLDCIGCDSRFVHPIPTSEDFERIYARSNYHDLHYAELTRGQFARSLRILAKFSRPGVRVLDFGCGNGEFLKEAADAGYVCEGIELDAAAGKAAAANSGCDVISLHKARQHERRYDVVHLGDVLEHLPDPAAVMRELETFMVPTGLFLIEGPLEENRSLVAFTAAHIRRLKASRGRSNHAEEPPFHLTRTSARSQRHFFECTLGCRLRHFEVYESGWPYVADWRDILAPKRVSTAVRGLIGKAAIGFASMANIGGLGMGDRFVAVIQPAGLPSSNSR